MAPLILSFLKRYPQVHIDLVTEGRLVDIVAGGYDMGVRSADLVPTDMIALTWAATSQRCRRPAGVLAHTWATALAKRPL